MKLVRKNVIQKRSFFEGGRNPQFRTHPGLEKKVKLVRRTVIKKRSFLAGGFLKEASLRRLP